MKKPIKKSDFVTDSNFNVILFTEKQAISYVKKHVNNLNKALKALPNDNGYRYKFVAVKDCLSHWNYTIV